MPAARMIAENELREPRSYASVAVVRVTRAELLSRGVVLESPVDDGTWDEAGPIQEALVEVNTGEQALLILHPDLEELPSETGNRAPLELRAPISTPDPTAFVDVVLDALDIARERAEWVVGRDEWAALQVRAAQYRGAPGSC